MIEGLTAGTVSSQQEGTGGRFTQGVVKLNMAEFRG